MAAPARPAARSGPALSPHEKALRFSRSLVSPRSRLRAELLRFEERFWVRVAMGSSLSWVASSTLGEGPRSYCETLSHRLSPKRSKFVGRLLRLFGGRLRFG